MGIATLVLIAIATAIAGGGAIAQVVGWLRKREKERLKLEERLRRLEREHEKQSNLGYEDRGKE